MRLPAFDYVAPTSLDEVLAILAEQGRAAAVLAGGTDLIPRLRQRLDPVDLLVSLKNLADLKKITLDGLNLRIGTAASLWDLRNHPSVQAELPGLVQALATIGGRYLQQEKATIGGNLLLNTRCIQYNQSDWWRSGRDRCFKNGGQVCHVLKESQQCSAVCQSDGAPMLIALSAQAEVRSANGTRTLALAELYSGQGETPFTLAAGELLKEITIFLPPPGTGTAFHKLRWRTSVDFPLVSAAALVSMSKNQFDRVRLVIGGAGPAPILIEEAGRMLKGRVLDSEAVDQAALAAMKAASGTMVENTLAPAEYRRKMVRVLARRAIMEAAQKAGETTSAA